MSTETTEPKNEDGRERDFDSVQARLERHTLMAALGTRFLSVPADAISLAVDDALAAIGRFAGADRVALALLEPNGERWSVDHDWHSEGLRPLRGLSEHVTPFRWALPVVLANNPLEILCLDDIPPAGASETLLFRGIDLQAILVIPVSRGGRVAGFACLGSKAPRHSPWPSAFRELLELPGRMMIHALECEVAEKRLRESQARWASVCDSNVVGVFATRRSDGTVVECNETGLRVLGRTAEELKAGTITWFNTTPPEERDTDVRMLVRSAA